MQIDIGSEVIALRRMTANELGERYAQVFGERTRAGHKPYLIRKIAWRLQAMLPGLAEQRRFGCQGRAGGGL